MRRIKNDRETGKAMKTNSDFRSTRLRSPRSLLGALIFALALLAPAAGAQAAVSFGITATHQTQSPPTIFRGDAYMTYTITLKNTGDTPTTSATNLNMALPPGVTIDRGRGGANWSCLLTAETCTYTGPAVNPNANFTVLNVDVFLEPALLPATPTVTFTAFGGGATSATIAQYAFTLGPQLEFGLVPASFKAKAEDESGIEYTQAGGHPFRASTAFEFATRTVRPITVSVFTTIKTSPFENVRDAAVNLPPGFVANPTAIVGGCKVQQVTESKCPERFGIGRAYADLGATTQKVDQEAVVYKVVSEKGYPAEFAFRAVGISPVTVVLRPKIRPGDFTVTAFAPRPPQLPALYAINYFTFCSYGAQVVQNEGINWKSPGCKQSSDAGALSKPFLTNPTRCDGQPDVTSIDMASYQHPGAFDSEGFPDLSDSDWKSFKTESPDPTGCNNLEFDPSFEGRPTTNVADAPTGLDFNLHIPQDGLLHPGGLAPAHLRDSTVVLPEGMVVNPSAATGLEACSPAQIGLVAIDHPAPYPIRFDGKPVSCPEGSKVGNVTISSPLVDETLQGAVYLAHQDNPATTTPGAENPFDSLLALYLVVRNDEIGLSAKLAGKVTPDQKTGQLTAVFTENPQLPFEDLHLEFFKGARASLRTPSVCGVKTTRAEFTPWSAPESGPPAMLTDSFAISTAAGNGNCPTAPGELPNAPNFTAGTVSPKAGAYSPFVLKLSREDGSQELKGLQATLPPGLTGRLAGVPYCSEAQIAAATARSKPGEGSLELANPSCPAASEVGKVFVSAGAGPAPYETSGRAYLSGPYKGAPISMVVITPAVAGPFDLGTVVVRNALYVNPVTAQVSVKSDPIPTILEGIPLDVRSIAVSINRNQFTLNPTSCNPMSITGVASAVSTDAALTERFQVGECKELGFKPGLKLRLRGGTKRAEYQKLTATVTYPKGNYANIARASVALPHSLFLAQEHIRTVCTRVQFAAKACPPGSVYGSAEATTPLLDQPLKGPVYLRSSSNPLPDLVVALRGPDGQPIEVELAGRTDSVHGGIRNTFDLVPDAPVSKFTLRLLGGKKSLIVNSRNLCTGVQRATAKFTAQNGLRYEARPVVANDCKKQKKGTKKAKKGAKQSSAGASASLARVLKGW
jgi:hypothetical protein